MSTKINADQICSVIICINNINTGYKYYEEKRGLFTKRKAGFYYVLTLHTPLLFTEDQIQEDTNLVIKDKKVYYKPHINIRMSNSQQFEMFFESEEELKAYMNKEPVKSINWMGA